MLKGNQTHSSAESNTKRVLNKKLEKYIAEAIDLFDAISEVNQKLVKEGLNPSKMSEFLSKGSSIEKEDINEELKAKFLYRLVRQYRHTIEIQRQ